MNRLGSLFALIFMCSYVAARLDGENATIRASDLDVVDLSVNKRMGRKVELNLAVDNLFNSATSRRKIISSHVYVQAIRL